MYTVRARFALEKGVWHLRPLGPRPILPPLTPAEGKFAVLVFPLRFSGGIFGVCLLRVVFFG